MALDDDEKQYLETAKKAFIKWSIGIIGSICIGLIVFYFNTQSTLSAHDKDLNEIKIDVRELRDKIEIIAIDPAKTNAEIKAIKEMVKDISDEQKESRLRNERDQKEWRERQDKIYDYVFKLANGRK